MVKCKKWRIDKMQAWSDEKKMLGKNYGTTVAPYLIIFDLELMNENNLHMIFVKYD